MPLRVSVCGTCSWPKTTASGVLKGPPAQQGAPSPARSAAQQVEVAQLVQPCQVLPATAQLGVAVQLQLAQPGERAKRWGQGCEAAAPQPQGGELAEACRQGAPGCASQLPLV